MRSLSHDSHLFQNAGRRADARSRRQDEAVRHLVHSRDSQQQRPAQGRLRSQRWTGNPWECGTLFRAAATPTHRTIISTRPASGLQRLRFPSASPRPRGEFRFSDSRFFAFIRSPITFAVGVLIGFGLDFRSPDHRITRAHGDLPASCLSVVSVWPIAICQLLLAFLLPVAYCLWPSSLPHSPHLPPASLAPDRESAAHC